MKNVCRKISFLRIKSFIGDGIFLFDQTIYVYATTKRRYIIIFCKVYPVNFILKLDNFSMLTKNFKCKFLYVSFSLTSPHMAHIIFGI